MSKHSNKSFVANVAIYILGSILMQVASIVLLPLYLNFLSPSEFGILEILNRFAGLITIGLMANGFTMAAWTFYCQSESSRERETTAFNVSIALFVIIGVGIIATIATAGWITQWLHLESSTILIFGSVAVLCEALFIVPLALMQARMESSRYVLSSFVAFLFRVLLTIVLVACFDFGLWGVFAARSATALLVGGWLNIVELRRSRLQFDSDSLKQMFRFALPFLPAGLLAFFIQNGDRFFLIRFVGTHELGIYALSYRFASLVSVFAILPLYKVWGAKMYEAAEKPDAQQVFGAMFTRIIGFGLFVSVLVALFAFDVIHLLGGYAYVSAVNCLPPLLMAVVLEKAADLMDAGFYIKRKTKYKPWIFAVTGIVILAGYSLLIPRFGNLGAAWATAIAYGVHATTTYVVGQRVFRVNYEWRRVIVLASVTAVVVLLSLLFREDSLRVVSSLFLLISWVGVAWAIATGTERQQIIKSLKGLRARCSSVEFLQGEDR